MMYEAEPLGRLRDCLPNLTHLILCCSGTFEDELPRLRSCCRLLSTQRSEPFLCKDDDVLQYIRDKVLDREGDINVEFAFEYPIDC
jgi:hypothetical protein